MNEKAAFEWQDEFVESGAGFPLHLTHRQRDVLLLLCEGMPNKRIGRRLGIEATTVKSHVASVLRSLNAGTRLEAVAVAHRLGLVRPCDSMSREPAQPPHAKGITAPARVAPDMQGAVA